ncbi:MAG TPA: efflux RND transporter periplasmic adaptor subunit [Gemmatimonadaceae bacterium]|nr:efflux RND transporter periplasmic adaptor subunit [Gemmatimonadaceae bacterium]
MRARFEKSHWQLVLLFSLAACSTNGSARPADSSNGRTGAFALTPEQRNRIHLVTVQNQPFRPTLEATGTVAFNGDRSTPVLSPISGPALQILVNPGAVVKKGDALATVSSPDFAAAVASYRKAESAFRNLKRIADLDEQLFKNDAIARRDLEQAQTDASGAAADRDAAVQQMRALGVQEAQIDAIRQDKPMTEPLQATIRAPLDGTVVEKLISPGQLLQAGTTPCFTIADLSTMWVFANVFPSDVKDVAVGETVDVVTDASTTPLQGRVDYVAALVDPNSKAVSVRVLVPNLNHILRRDMFVHMGIHANHEHTGLLVPTTSVLRDEENLPFVYVAAPNGSFDRRSITLGSRVDNRYEVVSGIAPGDKVVAEGALFLQFAESQ